MEDNQRLIRHAGVGEYETPAIWSNTTFQICPVADRMYSLILRDLHNKNIRKI